MDRSLVNQATLVNGSIWLIFLLLHALILSGSSAALILLVLLTTPFWALIHEAIHGQLAPGNRDLNKWMGRVLAILFGCPLAILQAGHLGHHAYNRSADDIVDIKANSKTLKSKVPYYSWILGGLYISEFFSTLLCFLPPRVIEFLEGMPWTDVLQKRIGRAIRTNWPTNIFDAFCIVCFHGSLIWVYASTPYILIAFYGGRAILISLLDNSYHYGTPVDDKLFALNLGAPKWLSTFILNANYHGVHHLHPNTPWYQLPQIFKEKGYQFHRPLISQVFSQLEGPMEHSRWDKQSRV